jgi:hypothetical protein
MSGFYSLFMLQGNKWMSMCYKGRNEEVELTKNNGGISQSRRVREWESGTENIIKITDTVNWIKVWYKSENTPSTHFSRINHAATLHELWYNTTQPHHSSRLKPDLE